MFIGPHTRDTIPASQSSLEGKVWLRVRSKVSEWNYESRRPDTLAVTIPHDAEIYDRKLNQPPHRDVGRIGEIIGLVNGNI